MNYKIGQSLWFEGQKKTIRRLIKNINGVTIIEWESRHQTGVTMTGIWEEWLNNIDQNERRASKLCVCDPKPQNRKSKRSFKR